MGHLYSQFTRRHGVSRTAISELILCFFYMVDMSLQSKFFSVVEKASNIVISIFQVLVRDARKPGPRYLRGTRDHAVGAALLVKA